MRALGFWYSDTHWGCLNGALASIGLSAVDSFGLLNFWLRCFGLEWYLHVPCFPRTLLRIGILFPISLHQCGCCGAQRPRQFVRMRLRTKLAASSALSLAGVADSKTVFYSISILVAKTVLITSGISMVVLDGY